MKESTEATPETTEDMPARSKEFDRRLALLRTEVSLDFPKLIPQLEAGQQVVLVTDHQFAYGLEPDVLRRFGGMIMLCSFYGAAVVFVSEGKILELAGNADSGA